MQSLEERLKGGHPNSLGNTIEIVGEVLRKNDLFDALFNCYFSNDEVVRLRVSNAMKRIAKANGTLLVPYLNRFLDDISKIDQASTQWTLAQLFLLLENDISEVQMEKAIQIMKYNLVHHQDWIVLNQTMETLGKWAKNNMDLESWLQPHLYRLSKDSRKSVSKKASKLLATINH